MQANLGLLKVLVTKSEAEGLHTHLRSMVEGVVKWQDNTKIHFKAKVGFSAILLLSSVAMAKWLSSYTDHLKFSLDNFELFSG